MSPLSTLDIAQATQGHLHGEPVLCQRVTTDSRQVQAGDLYIALRGETFNGHDFAQAALNAGAAAVMVDQTSGLNLTPSVEVKDTRIALGRLAAEWRTRLPVKLIAITGSSGKTTVKDMLANILRAEAGADQVWATQGNLNNDIGMPLTLLGLNAHHQYAVIEMGMNHAGEIGYLVELAQPDMVLINNAGCAHVGMLGSVLEVAKAKGEIILGAPPHAQVILNADDAYTELWRSFAASREVLLFSGHLNASTPVHLLSYSEQAEHSLVHVAFPNGELNFRLPLLGQHNVMNALASLTVAYALGVSKTAMCAGLESVQAAKARLQSKPGKQGARLWDDSYNANPESTRAAIDVLAAAQGIRILIMGDMGELGAMSGHAHAEIGRYAKTKGIDMLFALGAATSDTVKAFGAAGQHFDDAKSLVQAVLAQLNPQTCVLIKGSRFMRMERVVQQLERVN